MKMLLGALGYDAINEGYVGSNWSIQVAKRALNIELDKGLVGDFAGAKALTREEACLYAFNALNAQMVAYENDSKITVGDIVISNSSKAELVWDDVAKTNPTLFRDQYFKKLDKVTAGADGVDAFARPSHTWYTSTTKHNDDTKIGEYADAADYTVVLEKNYPDTVDVYTDLIDKDYAGTYGTEKINGASWTGAETVATGYYYGIGDTVEFFLNADTGAVTKTITTRYDIAEITKVSTSLTKAQKEDGATAKFQIDGGSTWYFDNDVVGFDAETYVKDAYILFVAGATTGTMIASEIAESIEGTVTATKGTKVAVDGVFYENVAGALSVGAEGTFYLGKAGEIKDFEATVKNSENYAYIYNLDYDNTSKNEDGVVADTWTAYYVTVDGVKGSASVKTEKDSSSNYYFDDGKSGQTAAWALSKSDVTTGMVVAFKIDADGKFVREVEKDVIEAEATSADIAKTDATVASGVYATAETKFVFVKNSDGAYKPSVVTGYKNVNVTADMFAVTNVDTDEALFVFVDGYNGSVTVDAKYAVILDNVAVVTEDADGEAVYTYAVAIGDDNDATLSFTTAQSFTKGQVYAYKLDNDGMASNDSSVTLYTATVSTVTANYVVVDCTVDAKDGQYNIGEETAYTIDMEYKVDAVTLESVTVSEGCTYDKTAGNNTIYFTVDSDGAFDTVFVVNNIK